METISHPVSSKPTWKVVVGVFALLLLFALAAKVLVGLTPAVPDEDAARGEERAKAWVDLQAENKTKLETYAWADKAQGQVQIPISQAMEMTIAQINSKPPVPAGPVNPPAAAPAPAPAAPADASAPATPTAPAAPAPSPAAQPAPKS